MSDPFPAGARVRLALPLHGVVAGRDPRQPGRAVVLLRVSTQRGHVACHQVSVPVELLLAEIDDEE